MKPQRRWLQSVIAASNEPLPALPWERGNRRRPVAMKAAAPASAPAPARAPASVAAR